MRSHGGDGKIIYLPAVEKDRLAGRATANGGASDVTVSLRSA